MRLTRLSAVIVLRAGWALSWPLRTYWLYSEKKLGKRWILDTVAKRFLPPIPNGFPSTVPGGATVFLYYREDLGLTTLLGGGFERAELETARRLAVVGTTAIDVGANVGLHTAVLAAAVGPAGQVLAFEPEESNFARLCATVADNHFANVSLYRVALLSSQSETAVLHLATDPAYHSLGEIYEGRSAQQAVEVEARTLDDVWQEHARPPVSFLKIDTEGTEFEVLRGAELLLQEQAPALLVETRDPRIAPWLADRGYQATRPSDFALGNVLFQREAIIVNELEDQPSLTRST